MANEIVVATTANDQEKMLVATLLKRSHIKLVMSSLCDKIKMEQGTGLTAYFIRYRRMNVPLVTITEATDPANSSFSLDQVSVTLDEWGDIITVSSRAILTTKHPLIQQAIALLADNAARVMDREIQLVLLAGTNIQYGDGSVLTRRTVTSNMTINEVVITKARIAMVRAGAPPKGGPSGDAVAKPASGMWTNGQSYVAVCGPNVLGDVTRPGATLGTFAAVATYQGNGNKLYNYEVGTWLGMRWVETNFIPEFTLLGDSTVAIASAAAGTNGMPVITTSTTGGTIADAAVIYWKITRIDLLRGFEECISIEHTTSATSSANTNKFTLAFPATSGYVYNAYVGSATGDANLKLAVTQAAASVTSTVTTLASGSTTTPPDNILSTDASLAAVHCVYVFADDCLSWVGFFDTKVEITADQSIIGNVLRLKRAIGYHFYGKAVIKDQTRILRLEVASTY